VWTLPELKAVATKWQAFRRDDGYWNAAYIQNHDHARAVSRFGCVESEEWRNRSAKMLALMQVAQGGTLYVYQGEELGMKNFPASWGIEEYKDIATINYYNKWAICLSFFPGGRLTISLQGQATENLRQR